MELREVIRRRRMVRSFDPERPVDEAVVDRVLRHAVRSPSAGHSQGWDFVVLGTPQDRDLFWSLTTDAGRAPDRWLRGVSAAPVLVLCCSDPQAYLGRYAEPDKGWADRDVARWPVPYWDVDNGMAAMLMLLTAVDEGLAALYFGVPPERHDAVRAAFAIPADRRLVGVVALGHPAADRSGEVVGSGRRRPRRPLREVAHRGRFGAPWTPAGSGAVAHQPHGGGEGERHPGQEQHGRAHADRGTLGGEGPGHRAGHDDEEGGQREQHLG